MKKHSIGISLACACASVLALAFPVVGYAGYPVLPAAGTSIIGQPTFLIYLGDGETLPEVTVADNPDMSGPQGSCYPYTPFTEPHKYTCTLLTQLQPGTYYWQFSYFANDACSISFGVTICSPQQHTSAPPQFAVVAPTAPTGASLVSPGNGATVTSPVKITAHVPAGSDFSIYLADTADRADDGSALVPEFYCSGHAQTDGDYYCTKTVPLLPGERYYWWLAIRAGGTAWVYGPRTLQIRDSSLGSFSGSTGSTNGASSSTTKHTTVTTHDASYAPYLPSARDFTGASIKDTRLSIASYFLTKLVGKPTTVDVACWSDKDWPSVSGDPQQDLYPTTAFWSPGMPHWVNLSPKICRAMETLLNNRPTYPNIFTAEAVETLTHEMMHAIGIRTEAIAECFGMQLSFALADTLGVPNRYSESLAHLNLVNYLHRPPSYINTANCRENGAWDLFPNRPSPPWHG